MKKKIILIIILAIIIISGITAFIWHNYQKTERQYQACLDGCKAENTTKGLKSYIDPEYLSCLASCREKYAK